MNHAGMAAGAVLLMAAVMATAAALGRCIPFYRRELARMENRELPLDGLRGMAALLVIAHHAGLSYGLLVNNRWKADSAFISLLGPMGVSIFFMLTGYLFWKKARAARGKIRAAALWRGRFFRIAPLYWFSLCFVLILAFATPHAHLLEPANWPQFLRLLLLGGPAWQPIGATDFAAFDAGVTWTLTYEWWFYALLPFLAWLAVGRTTYWMAILAYLVPVAGWWRNTSTPAWVAFSLPFVAGMMCAVLLDDDQRRSRLRRAAVTVLALAALASIFVFRPWHARYSGIPGALLAPVFLVAAAGNTFFGFLVHPAVRCLGAISYSLYLLHGTVFYVTVLVLKKMGLANLSEMNYWLIITLAAMATTVLCAATYRWIEFPFMTHRPGRPQAVAAGARHRL